MKKNLLIIIDGMGDRPIAQLGDRTPLEAAKTPNLDFLAKKGVCGLVLPYLFPKETLPTSEGAHVALFGYEDYFLGRGPYETAGIGMKMKKGDIAFRVNFGTVNEKLKVTDRRAGRIEETQSLIKALNGIKIDGKEFLIKKSFGHRAGLILRGRGLSPKISDGDPHKTGVKIKNIIPLDKSKEARKTADILNKFLRKTHQILKNHPKNKEREKKGRPQANYLLIRGAGMLKDVPSFKKMHNLRACCIAGGGLYKGVARILGMDIINVKGATGMADTNLKEKFSAAKKAFYPVKSAKGGAAKPQFNRVKKYNFVFCHIKATDTFAHDGNFIGKKDFIEKIDKALKPLLRLKNVLITITADHSTCSELKDHCLEPIPILIFSEKLKGGQLKNFSEKSCKKGRLGRIKQTELMKTILNFL